MSKKSQYRIILNKLVVIFITCFNILSCSDPTPRDRQHQKTINQLGKDKATQDKANTKRGYYEVLKVVDGDTFWILNANNEREKIRLIGIDTPEKRNSGRKKIGYYGEEASQYTEELLEGKYVRLEYDVQLSDRYGRTLAYVYLENGSLLNDLLVREGYATVATFPPNVKYVDLFITSEEYARSRSLGLWNKP